MPETSSLFAKGSVTCQTLRCQGGRSMPEILLTEGKLATCHRSPYARGSVAWHKSILKAPFMPKTAWRARDCVSWQKLRCMPDSMTPLRMLYSLLRARVDPVYAQASFIYQQRIQLYKRAEWFLWHICWSSSYVPVRENPLSQRIGHIFDSCPVSELNFEFD